MKTVFKYQALCILKQSWVILTVRLLYNMCTVCTFLRIQGSLEGQKILLYCSYCSTILLSTILPLARRSFTVPYYEVGKRKSSKYFFIMWSLWSLIDWILLARAQNLRKVCNSSIVSKEKHNFIICFFSLSILIAHVEPEHQNQHSYVWGWRSWFQQ